MAKLMPGVHDQSAEACRMRCYEELSMADSGLSQIGQIAINVHDINDVIWAITTRADAARDVITINNTPTDTLDPASPLVNFGSKLGIDATQKTKEEGYQREIQELVSVDEDTKNLVDAKWSSYGI